jgi:hypothetical protein
MDFVAENLGEGTDAIYSTISLSTLAANVETLVLQEGAGNLNGTGNGRLADTAARCVIAAKHPLSTVIPRAPRKRDGMQDQRG